MATLANAQDVTREQLIEVHDAAREVARAFRCLQGMVARFVRDVGPFDLSDERLIDAAEEAITGLRTAFEAFNPIRTTPILDAIAAPHGTALMELGGEFHESWAMAAVFRPCELLKWLYRDAARVITLPIRQICGGQDHEVSELAPYFWHWPQPTNRDMARSWLRLLHTRTRVQDRWACHEARQVAAADDWDLTQRELELRLDAELRAAVVRVRQTPRVDFQKLTRSATTLPAERREPLLLQLAMPDSRSVFAKPSLPVPRDTQSDSAIADAKITEADEGAATRQLKLDLNNEVDRLCATKGTSGKRLTQREAIGQLYKAGKYLEIFPPGTTHDEAYRDIFRPIRAGLQRGNSKKK